MHASFGPWFVFADNGRGARRSDSPLSVLAADCRKTLALGTGIRQSNRKFITGVVLDAALGKKFFGKKVFGSGGDQDRTVK